MPTPYLYQLQNASYDSLAAQDFRVAVVDMDDAGMTRDQVDALEASGKTMLTYISVGEAEDYRDYWGPMTENGPPSFLLEENEAWEGNYRVEFWNEEWQGLMMDRIGQAAEAGYGGAYLDIIDAYTVETVQARYPGTDIRKEMQDFVIKLSAHAKSINPDFMIVPQNAVGLLGETEETPELPNTDYLAAIDGIGVEDLWYDDDRVAEWTPYDLEFLRTALAADKFVLATSYPTQRGNQDAFIDNALSEGLIPFVGNRELDGTIAPANDGTAARAEELGIRFPGQTGGVPCFARDTLILTAQGPVAVQDLTVGTLIPTLDGGAQVLRWVGSVALDGAALRDRPALRPIRIRAGALGPNRPSADLLVSPQHRMLVQSPIVTRMFGSDVLVPAKDLVGGAGIEVVADAEGIEYFHILFDTHQIVTANGCASESLFTGPQALKALPAASRREILALFPHLRGSAAMQSPTLARPEARGARARTLVQRHHRNGRQLA